MAQAQPGGMFKWIIALLVLAAICGGVVGAYNIVRGPIFESLRMAQLAPLPAVATDLHHTSQQHDGVYEDDVTFSAPLPAIEVWLQRSPSVRKAQAPAVENGRRHYKLQTLPAASGADLYVEPAAAKVELILAHR